MPKTKPAPRPTLYRRMLTALQEEFQHRCHENKDQRRIDALDKLIQEAEANLYHWKD